MQNFIVNLQDMAVFTQKKCELDHNVHGSGYQNLHIDTRFCDFVLHSASVVDFTLPESDSEPDKTKTLKEDRP